MAKVKTKKQYEEERKKWKECLADLCNTALHETIDNQRQVDKLLFRFDDYELDELLQAILDLIPVGRDKFLTQALILRLFEDLYERFFG